MATRVNAVKPDKINKKKNNYENVKAFIMHMTFLSLRKSIIRIPPAKKAQIILLFVKKIKIPTKCLDFSDVF